MSHHILIVDDERALREELADFFHSKGLGCSLARNATEGLELAGARDFTVILLDVQLPDMNGTEMISRLRECSPESRVLMITAHPSVDTVITALREGASDYVIKPLILEDLLYKVRHMIEFRTQEMELRWHRQQLQQRYEMSNIVGRSEPMKEVFRLVERVGETATPVLITGESGAGKEVVARAIHYNGPRCDKRFIAINCAAIPASLLESQLFGHLKGAFTGAEVENKGVFATASGGTLFLDEIGDMPLELQPKLLRAIDNQEILPVGATDPVAVDTRILSSTTTDLQEQVHKGRFREDLFYRLAVVTTHMPPLRQRRDDIPALVEHFIRKLNHTLRRRIRGVTNDALRLLLRYDWKGNVRELQNVIERAMILEDGELITSAALPSNLVPHTHSGKISGPLKEAVRKFERDYVATILRTTNGDKRLAADLLGVSVSSLYRRMQGAEDELAPLPNTGE